MKTIVSLLVCVLVFCMVANAAQFNFQPQNDCSVTPFCKFDQPENWGNANKVPGQDDDVTIDFSAAKYNTIQYVTTTSNITVKSLTILGNGNSGLPDLTSCTTFTIAQNGLVFLVTGAVKLTNAKIALASNDEKSNVGQLILSEGNFDGDDIFINFDNVNSDVLSKFNIKGESIVGLFNDVVFYNTPKFTEHTTIIGGGNHIYKAGLMVQYKATFNYTTISGNSNIDSLTVISGLVLNNNAQVFIDGGAKFSGSASFDVMGGASVIFRSSEFVYLENVNIDGGCFVNVTSPSNCTGIKGDGTLFIDSSASTNIIDSTLTQLFLAGNSSVNLINTAVNNMANSATNQGTPGDDFTIFLNLEGTVQINAANLAHTTITSIDDSSVTFTNPDQVYLAGQAGLIITGTVTVTGPGTLNAGPLGINLQDPQGKLYLNNGASVRGPVLNTRGTIYLNGNNVITGNFDNVYGTVEIDYIGSTLAVNGNMTLNPESSLFFYNNVTAASNSPVTVSGFVQLGNSTVLVEFDETAIQFNTNYNLLQSTQSTSGQFGTVNSLGNGKLLTDQSRINVDLNPQQTFTVTSLEFYTTPLKPHKMAGWKVFLIVFSILIVLGAGGFGFYKWKTNQGYIRIN
ncbi:hypothetical protein CYY_009294 [Polysphondylium violaceum]|uniref:Transmembrane protein n=1 Tax=Polysphondylium violaceum TaxID=133409 RepID=A0A8J4UW67_9MYCE|nr:hypothetical protein CYY_009294 [Polysphondylium violaceum]